MSYLSTVTTEDDLHREREEHNAVRNEFNTTLKMAKKAIKKSRSRDEPTKEDSVGKARAEIVRKDKHLQDTFPCLELQSEEANGKLSSFHLDDIKEASNKLEYYYQSQIAPVYNDLMERGSKILQ